MLPRPQDLTSLLLKKESSKAIIVVIANPNPKWDHRVYEKKGEKIDKYQGLKRDIGKLWGIQQQEVLSIVVGALRAVS